MRYKSSIIFLGVSFDKWYVSFLLRELAIDDQDFGIIKHAINKNLNRNSKEFCEEQFTIKFISEEIEEFVEQLYIRMKSKEFLRKADQVREEDEITRWKFLFLQDPNPKRALEQLWERLCGTEFENKALGLLAGYNRLALEIASSTVKREDALIETNRISKSYFDLIDEAKKYLEA